MRNVFNVLLQNDEGAETVLVTEIPSVCASMYRPGIPADVLSSIGDEVMLVDPGECQVEVDILIGLDSYWKLMTPEIKSLPDGLVAQRTIFGWVISGLLPTESGSSSSQVQVFHQLVCLDVSKSAVDKLWDLESVGIFEESAQDPTLRHFSDTVQYEDGRYVVSLPWKESLKPKLMSNKSVAMRRLESLDRKLDRNPVLRTQYNEAICDMEASGIIHEVPVDEVSTVNPVFYMPHRPVVKEQSLTTKVRPVFDASAKGINGLSLNDCLETGPCLLPNLVEVLIRFRRWKVALIADVKKAFLQIRVQKPDQDIHRFLWKPHDHVRIMRFDRVPFGNTSSPFLLNATVQHHLAKYDSSVTVSELKDNMYVDDWLTGADDDSVACDMVSKSSSIMNGAGMTWGSMGSSSETVTAFLQQRSDGKQLGGGESVKVLGLRWRPDPDSFSFEGVDVPKCLVVTKRVVLSLIARVFDPLGYLNPFLVTAKRIFQDLWIQGVDWDQVIPEPYHNDFVQWVEDLVDIRSWKIPRRYFEVKWCDIEMIQLHAFGDASERAYGCCVYLRVRNPDGTWMCSLVLSRVRVAPVKRISLPRLELMGALLCSRMVVFVRKALKLPEDVPCHCWTDSTVALAWIQNDPHKWKTFVSNRVAEIRSLTPPQAWHHCPGIDNPADLVTRGIRAQDMRRSDMWLGGPDFFRSDITDELKVKHIPYDEKASVIKHECRSKMLVLLSCTESGVFLDVERWSSFGKALRVVGYVLRFVNRLKTRVIVPSIDLTYEELSRAKVVLLSSVQKQVFKDEYEALAQAQTVPKKSPLFKLSPFMGSDGLIHVGGRLQHSHLSEAEKHPVVVPKGHLALLLARHVHILHKHPGVNRMLVALRDQYWIIGARLTCKKVKSQCMSCRRLDAAAAEQCMAPLPGIRVTPSLPFSVTGLDHGGPLYCSDCPGKKFYVLLFTCAVVRALHLELVESLSGEATVMALKRFYSRRGVPAILMSDNALGFKSAARQQLKMFGPDGPEWRFIVPRSPWWGGFWEILIRSVKSALKKSVGLRCLSRVELETVLHEVEGCINSRPLTYQSSSLDGDSPLTPSHFLLGRTVLSKPVVDGDGHFSVSRDGLFSHLSYRDEQLEKFWYLWVNSYLRSLPPFRGSSVDDKVQVGSLVLIKDLQCPRLQWPLGVIQKVFTGKDGHVRSVEVRTARGVLVRSIQHIVDLEVSDVKDTPPVSQVPQVPDTDIVAPVRHMQATDTAPSQTPHDLVPNVRTRFGRIVKPPSRLDL